MPTGPLHERLIAAEFDRSGRLTRVEVVECRCIIGNNHDDAGNEIYDWQDLEEGESRGPEPLSVSDAADIWISNGMDEDHTFGYSEDELRRAARMD